MLAIDTLQTAQRFQDAGLNPEQAKAFTEILKDAQQESIANFVTKDDLRQESTGIKVENSRQRLWRSKPTFTCSSG